jgi:hypothetical protein
MHPLLEERIIHEILFGKVLVVGGHGFSGQRWRTLAGGFYHEKARPKKLLTIFRKIFFRGS